MNDPIKRRDTHKNSRQKGAVLLMTLSVILLLSLALMKTFEKRSLEMAHLKNSQTTFQAEMAARSALRFLLKETKNQGVESILNFLSSTPEETQIELEAINASLSDIRIEPLDDRLHLRSIIGNINGSENLQIFTNLINQILQDRLRKDRSALNQSVTEKEVSEIIADINDWNDKDILPNIVNEEYGTEQYPTKSQTFQVKNRNYDVVSELKLLPKLQSLHLTSNELNRYFRVIPKKVVSGVNNTEADSTINVNMASEDQIIKFLERFENSGDFDLLFAERENIAKKLTEGREGFPKYKNYTDLYKDLDEISDRLSDLYGTREDPKLFKIESTFIAIHFTLTVDSMPFQVRSIVEIEYLNTKTYNISRFTLHQFQIL